MVREKKVEDCFSEELSWIKDKTPQEKVVSIWKTAADERGWKSIPDEIAHIIYSHSHEGEKTKRSAETVIVNHCDFVDFHIQKSMVEQ